MKWLWLSALILAVDQLTKYIISHALALYESVKVFAGFNVTLVHNSGAAFSFLRDAGGWQRWFFIGLSSIISGVILFWLFSTPPLRRWFRCSLALILGGAVGNLLDRILYGYVIDFFDVSIPFLSIKLFNPWPAFNVADAAITVGVIMLVIDTFWFDPATVSVNSRKSDKG
ncbi:MAG: lipoprotein signal peptidase [Gammaproteobacteria bacterium]|nr:lipoprotein signal peptidase [Gammaproteobacteria bacterium]